ncbi:MAG TPA: ATP-binding cassette domain-containing protein [Crenotrichaceae bacterium]|nr:ATP-binding cassette domain-containing protein [Crenotrichaceae bacterium]
MLYNLSEVTKTRVSRGVAFHLSIPSLHIATGEKIALIAESGCGKSTLLDLLALISQPTTSGYFNFHPQGIDETVDISKQWGGSGFDRISDLRKHHIGYVMQAGGLLPFLTVKENINLSREVLGLPEDGTALKLARKLHISSHLKKLPDALSLGERQRVAICRALAHNPAVVIADEPTASLDPFSADAVMKMFVELVEELDTTLIVASHSWQYVKKFGLRRLSHHSQRLPGTRTMHTTISG